MAWHPLDILVDIGEDKPPLFRGFISIVFELIMGVWTLANTAQAKKRARQNEKRRQHNASRRSEMRTYIKRVFKAVSEKNHELAATEYRLASSMVDRMAAKGLIHKNKAARHKSRLNSHIKKLVVAS